MKSIVCVKQISDVSSNFMVDQDRIIWGDAPQIINPFDEFAIEAALVQKENKGGEVIALSIGDENAREALKHALSMGCDHSVLVSVNDSKPLDSLSVASILAAAIQKIGDVDLAFFGKQASDTELGVLAVQTARKLHWPVLTLVSVINEVNETGKTISAIRTVEEGRQSVKTKLPAVLSINKDFGEPRFPSFMGTRKAAKAVIPIWTLTDLGISPVSIIEEFGTEHTHPRGINLEMIKGDSVDEIAAELVARLTEEKVI